MSNAATVQFIPSARRSGKATAARIFANARIFDLAGNHLQQHGPTVYCNTPRVAGQVATPVAVFSKYGMGTGGNAQVFIQADTGPFVLAMALSSDAAREHAYAMLAAADRADEVQAIVKAAV